MEYRAIYDDEYISHHGVKGMRWGYRKDGGPQGYLGTYPKAGLHDVHSLTNVNGGLSIGRNSKRRRMESYIHATRGDHAAYRQRLARQAEKHYRTMATTESARAATIGLMTMPAGLLTTTAGAALGNPAIVAAGLNALVLGGLVTGKHLKKSTAYDRRREIATTAFNEEMKNHRSTVWFDENLRPHDKDMDAYVKKNFDSSGRSKLKLADHTPSKTTYKSPKEFASEAGKVSKKNLDAAVKKTIASLATEYLDSNPNTSLTRAQLMKRFVDNWDKHGLISYTFDSDSNIVGNIAWGKPFAEFQPLIKFAIDDTGKVDILEKDLN